MNWYPWGKEAFKLAQEQDKPILLDIGAVWCHWCHVMDSESYENSEIAALINEMYIAIKVDRDERPDIDRRYQLAVSAITEGGGWPLTAFLTPAGTVFFGGTYFPPENKFDRTGMKNLLPRVYKVYKERKTEVLESAERLYSLVNQQDSYESGELNQALG